MQPFVVMAKPVGARCNLECGYCYYSAVGKAGSDAAGSAAGLTGVASSVSGSASSVSGSSGAAPPARMDPETLERLITQYIRASAGPVVSFTWHGGEPSLAGIEFYKHAIEVQKRCLPDGWTCWNNLQTNGTLLDDEWCAFLADADFDVGLSIDGTEALHDSNRKDHAGRGTYRSAASALKCLQEHGLRPDLLCTVTSEAAKDPLSVYRALRDLGSGWLQFIPIVRRAADGALTGDSVTPEGYGSFLCDIFDEWSLYDIGRLDIQLVAEMTRVHSGGSAGLCWMSPTCGRALIAEQDGGIYSCDHFVNADHYLGNIAETPLGELANLPAQLRFGNDKRDLLPDQCMACDWLRYCNGGCPKDRFDFSDQGEPGLNCLCGGLRRFFSHAQPGVELIANMAGNGNLPVEVMAAMRKQRLTAWRNVGRNDPCPCGSGLKAKHCCWDKRP